MLLDLHYNLSQLFRNKMKKSICSAIIALTLTSSASVLADDKVKHLGATLDCGIPDGAGLGLIVKPYWYWLGVSGAATFNGFAPGVRGGIKFDPVRFAIRPTINIEAGHSFNADLSNIAKGDFPKVNYSYANFHLGAEFGSNNGFSFFVHGGPSIINIQTENFQKSVDSNLTVSNPKANLWAVPTAKLGFVWMFL